MNKVRIGDICKITTGKYDVNEGSPDGEYPFFTCAAEPLKSNHYSFDGEAILLAGNGANVGLTLFYNGKFEAYQRTYVLHKFNAYPRYVYFYFKSFWKSQVSNKQYGSATNYIRLDNITDFKIPLPDLKTQQEIAHVLEQADKACQQRKAANSLTDEFLQSSFLSLFGDPVKNEKGWEVKIVEDIADKGKHGIKAGPFGSSLKKEFYVEKGYRIYGQEQVIRDDLSYGDYYIDEERYKTLESCKIQAGDILISLVGTYGKIAIVPEQFEPGIINPRLMKITPNKKIINPIFFKFLLTSDATRKQIEHVSRGGTMDIVNVGIMKEIKIYLPPLSLQQQFAGIVAQAEQLRQKQRESERELENLFQGLLQRYFG